MHYSVAADLTTGGGWVEIEHDLQKKRDGLRAAEAREDDKSWRRSTRSDTEHISPTTEKPKSGEGTNSESEGPAHPVHSPSA